MGVMSLLCYIFMLSCWFASKQGDHCKYYIKLSYKSPWALCFSHNSLVVIGVCEHRGWCSHKGEGYLTTLVKIPCNKSNKGKIITRLMGHLFQVENWTRHPSVGVHFS